jgi:predicted hydrocarbon binding protein
VHIFGYVPILDPITIRHNETSMKGIVFTTFNDMVEKQVGIDTWDAILKSVNPTSNGIYTSVEDFPDEELSAMVAELSKKTGTPIPELLKAFGQYLFHVLAMKHTIFVEKEPLFLEFLKSIEDVIHKEVRKLYPNPNLPSLSWSQENENSLDLFYRSPRKLCHLADGLIRGAGEKYQAEFAVSHDPCMHNGSDHCCFKIKLL